MKYTLFLGLSLALVAPAGAQTLRIPELSPNDPQVQAADCTNIPDSQDNCVRVLACIGDEGLWFDGQSRGWNQGTVAGAISDGHTCTGTWNSDGPFGAGVGQMTCSDGAEVGVLYTTQDGRTGTVIGQGSDTLGRNIRVWSGLNVLEFLTANGAVGAELPCGTEPIQIS